MFLKGLFKLWQLANVLCGVSRKGGMMGTSVTTNFTEKVLCQENYKLLQECNNFGESVSYCWKCSKEN